METTTAHAYERTARHMISCTSTKSYDSSQPHLSGSADSLALWDGLRVCSNGRSRHNHHCDTKRRRVVSLQPQLLAALTNNALSLSCSGFDESVVSLVHFSAAMVVEACVRCLRVILPDFDSSTTMPEVMSARYRMCSTLANACQVRVT